MKELRVLQTKETFITELFDFFTTPIIRFASAQYNYSPDDAEKFAEFVETKAQNQNFIKDLLQTMPEQKREAVLEMLQEGVK